LNNNPDGWSKFNELITHWEHIKLSLGAEVEKQENESSSEASEYVEDNSPIFISTHSRYR